MRAWIRTRKCLDENHAYRVRAGGLEFLFLFSRLSQCLRKKSILNGKCTREVEAARVGMKSSRGISSAREAKLAIWHAAISAV